MKTNLERAKAAIREAGLRYYCDRLKGGQFSLKVTDKYRCPISDDNVPKDLFYLLVGASTGYTTRPQVRRAVGGSGRFEPIPGGPEWTRFYFKQ